MQQVYPSIEELLPPDLQARVPASLDAWVRERYASLGDKYLTTDIMPDGRRVNSCMYKSSVQDALEEVVDAVFNVLVWLFKLRLEGRQLVAAHSALLGLIELYALLQLELRLEGPVHESL